MLWFILVKSGILVFQRVLFVEELLELMNEGLFDVWKFGQVYFSGGFIGDV